MKKVFLMTAFIFAVGMIFGQRVLTGTITNQSGEPLTGAYVYIPATKQVAASDDNGVYRFQRMRKDEYAVKVTYLGFLDQTQTVLIPKKAQETVLDFVLEEAAVDLGSVVVSATRGGEKTPFAQTIVKKEHIQRNNLGQDVPFLLQNQPSIVVTSDAGTGVGYTGMRIRGIDPTRINVTINGIPLNDPESQSVYWVDLPDFAASTEDILIQRGVGSSTNGAGAFGASVNLNALKIEDKPFGRISSSYGSFNTRKAAVSFGTGTIHDKFYLKGRYSLIGSDGYIDRASSDLKSYALSASYLGDKSSVTFNIFSGHEITYQAWNGVPAQYVDIDSLRTFNSAGMERKGTPYENEVDDYTQTHYQAIMNRQLNRNLNVNLALHYTKGSGYYEQYKAKQKLNNYGLNDILLKEANFDKDVPDYSVKNYIDNEDVVVETERIFEPVLMDTVLHAKYLIKKSDLVRRRWLDNDFYGLTYGINYTSNDKRIHAVLGGGWNTYEGDHFGEIIWAKYMSNGVLRQHYYDNTGEKTDFNIYGKINYAVMPSLRVFADLQYRMIGYEIKGVDNDGRDISQKHDLNFFNPKVGLFYEFSKDRRLFASFAVANREPNRNDYTDAKPGVTPEHEELYDFEFGYKKTYEKGGFGLNAYWMQYKNQLALTGAINDVGDAIRVNVPDSYRKGLELYGNYQFIKGFTATGNVSLSQNKIKEYTEYIDNWDTWGQESFKRGDTDLSFSPSIIGGYGVQYDILHDSDDDLIVSLSGKYVGKQYIDNASNENTVLAAYHFHDFGVYYTVHPKWIGAVNVKFLVRNLLDNKYNTNAWTYRYISEGYNGVPDDPHTRFEGDGVYNLTGFYPQAGRNFMIGLDLSF